MYIIINYPTQDLDMTLTGSSFPPFAVEDTITKLPVYFGTTEEDCQNWINNH